MFTPAPVSVWAIAWQELREPMILLLMVVGVFYAVWGGLRDAITIFVLIFCWWRWRWVVSSAPSVPLRV